MNKYILAGISFAAGSVVGGIAAWIVAKKRYERIHQETMNKVWADLQKTSQPKPAKICDAINVKSAASDGQNKSQPETVDTFEKPDLMQYTNQIRDLGYSAPDLPKTDDYIHEITVNDMDEEEYDVIDLVLYADGLLADDADMPLKNLEEAVGPNLFEMMQGKDEIIIRNERRKIDYDIVRSMLTYAELLDRHPETEQRLQFDNAMEDYYANQDDEDDENEEEEDE